MLKRIKQARAALSLLNPNEVRKTAERSLHIGLVASSDRGYAEMEDFLVPEDLPRDYREELLGRVHRAGDPDAPSSVDLVLYERGIPPDKDAFTFNRANPEETVCRILNESEDLALPLGRQFPAFRKPLVDRVIRSIARENALFAVTTALPNVLPSIIELPWAFGEFASDTAFLTANQIRMAFVIAAACGHDVGFSQQKAQVISIVASAFGWRAIARELAGKLPLGGGLIPKGAIAYAATYAVGKGLEYYHHNQIHHSPEQREEAYRHGFQKGREVVQTVTGPSGSPR